MTKHQSAMEYLMTYGWAILAIAIVMVSLYSLGIFNTGNLQPTATPGSCQVVKTAAQTSLAGQCNNMIPKYVGQFNGQNSCIDVSNGKSFTNLNQKTLSLWYYAYPYDGAFHYIWDAGYWTSPYGDLGYMQNTANTQSLYWKNSTGTVLSTNLGIQTNTWTNLAYAWNGYVLKVYVNGVVQRNLSISGTMANSGYDLFIGCEHGSTQPFNGILADVQLYNTSLDNASVRALYQEGIGGTPIDIQHLVGWWPLNGNANDYSGNDYQGTQIDVTWNANWQSGYTAPSA